MIFAKTRWINLFSSVTSRGWCYLYYTMMFFQPIHLNTMFPSEWWMLLVGLLSLQCPEHNSITMILWQDKSIFLLSTPFNFVFIFYVLVCALLFLLLSIENWKYNSVFSMYSILVCVGIFLSCHATKTMLNGCTTPRLMQFIGSWHYLLR